MACKDALCDRKAKAGGKEKEKRAKERRVRRKGGNRKKQEKKGGGDRKKEEKKRGGDRKKQEKEGGGSTKTHCAVDVGARAAVGPAEVRAAGVVAGAAAALVRAGDALGLLMELIERRVDGWTVSIGSMHA